MHLSTFPVPNLVHVPLSQEGISDQGRLQGRLPVSHVIPVYLIQVAPAIGDYIAAHSSMKLDCSWSGYASASPLRMEGI